MAVQLSVLVRNARLDAIEAQIGTSAKIKIFSGAVPADCAAADPSGLLVTMPLPVDWMNAAGSGQKTLLGSWSVAATNPGVAASFRLYATDGTTCGAQGTVTATGGGGDMTLDNTNIAAAQTVTVTAFTLTDANA
jgi:hypothetical protein